ncbi:MAG: hypothetical protein JO199_05880 [Candidatus Eremiobacteraeota bacterium]|nr:hypothetical protein [Candidatus Eremiobacteraeota bacterium]
MSRSRVALLCMLALSGCHGSPAGPAFLPASQTRESRFEPHANNWAIRLLVPPGSPDASGMAGAFYSSWTGTGTPVATFASNVSAKNPQCKTAQSTRTCLIPIAVKVGGPYELVVSLYDVAPVNGKFPGGKVIGGGIVPVTIGTGNLKQTWLTTAPLLGKTAIAVWPIGIPSIDSTTVRAIVTGYDKSNNAIVSNAWTGTKGAANVSVSADKASAPVFTFTPRIVTTPAKSALTIGYNSSKATAVQIAGFVATLSATPNATGITVQTTRLTGAPPQFKSVPLPQKTSYPYVIVAGPDKNMWFTEFNAGRVARIGTALTGLKEISGFAHPQSLVAGGDGAMWAADDDGNSAIAKITTAGVVTLYNTSPGMPVNTYPAGISAAPNNKLWFGSVNNNYINSISTAGTFGTASTLPAGNNYPLFSALGADGNTYFVLNGTAKIQQVSQAGALTRTYTIPGTKPSPQQIILGPDKNLWFTDGNQSAVFRLVTATGVFTKVSAGSYGVSGPLAIGPDGKIWFTTAPSSSCYAGRIDTSNLTRTVVGVGPKGCALYGIATGPDGALYFTNDNPAEIVRAQ